MTMDEIVLKFKSEFGKMKSDLSDTISKFQKLDNETAKSGKQFDNLSNPLDKLQSKLKSIQSEYDNLNDKLKRTKLSVSKESLAFTVNPTEDLKSAYENLNTEYNKLVGEISDKNKELASITDEIEYDNAVDSLNELGKKQGEILHNSNVLKKAIYFKEQFGDMSYDDVINSLKNYETEIDVTKRKINELSKSSPKIVPKTENAKEELNNVGKNADKASKSLNSFGNTANKANRSLSRLNGGLNGVGKMFNNLGKSFSKGIDNKIREIKKLALGLIGVRTAMSVLTKAVNAYLSFDGELQDSLTNSWNILGSLLAPAIELIAQLFALATNYVAQFVNALTGIDLVARANAKALQTQTKEMQKANKAQRGLLSMDEITNLPTESATPELKQITTINTKPIKWLNELLVALKKYKWHRAGEIIAESIDKGLKKINWDELREKAEQTGKNIATFLNGVFEVNWKLVGSTFANGLNTLIDLLHGFFTDLEWGRLGAGIANTINGFFNDFDFVKAGETVNAGILGILDGATAFIANLDSEKIANSIIDFLETIDWVKIGKKIIKLLIHGIRLATTFEESLWHRIVDDISKQIFPKIDELGEKIGGRLGKNIAKYLKNALSGAFNGFKLEIPGTGMSSTLFKILPLATGTNYIETEGIYHLHEGEEVVPKRYNPSADGYNNNTDNKQIIDLLVSLNASMLEYADRPISIDINGRKFAEATYNDFKQVDRNKNTSSVVVRS